MEAEEDIEIQEPKLSAPNYITIPNGSVNVFRFLDITIEEFEISIFNRNGIRVHHFEGNIRDWDGWDGRNDDGKNYVPTGVYFYIVKDYTVALPFDPKAIRNETWGSNSTSSADNGTGSQGSTTDDSKDETNNQFRGFFHVFNNE
jgi:hypothetical protein